MIIRSALLGLSALVSASAAHAETLFDVFQATCLKAAGSTAQALSLAEARGWGVMTNQEATSLGRMVGPSKAQFQGRADPAVRRAMVIGDVDTQTGGQNFSIKFCVVAGVTAQDESVRSEAADFAAVPANTHMAKDQGLYFAYTDQSGKHTEISNPEDDSVMLPLLKEGRPRVLVVEDHPGVAMFAYALPAKSPN